MHRDVSGAFCIWIKKGYNDMKNKRKYAALAAVILLLCVFCLPMLFAFGDSEKTQTLFRASFAMAFFVPVLLYIFLIIYKIVKKETAVQETNEKITNIIFDVGKVLVKFEWQAYLKSFGFSEEAYQKIAEATFLNELWNERDRGSLEEEEYVQKFVSLQPEYEAEIREVMRRSPEAVTVFDYAESWTGYLKKKGYRLYILSNYSHYMLAENQKSMTFLKHMDGILFSCKVNEIKPEAEIYQRLLETYGLDPDKSIFIDDREENCRAAEKFGIHTIVFQNFKQAVSELEKFGVE